MGNQLGTLQNLLTQATTETNVVATMTPSMVPPIVEDEKEYLGWLPNESVVIQATRLWAHKRRIELVAKAEAPIHKMNGKNLIGFNAMERENLLAQGDICGGQFLEGTPMDWSKHHRSRWPSTHNCHYNLGHNGRILGVYRLPLIKQGIQDLIEDELEEQNIQFEGLDWI